jgi:hypothetical protein
VCNRLELRGQDGWVWNVELRDCNGPNGCGVAEETIYHLLASGIFSGVRVEQEGRTVFDSWGGRGTKFVADFEAKRVRETKTDINVVLEVTPAPKDDLKATARLKAVRS